jgi:hypothetical protein
MPQPTLECYARARLNYGSLSGGRIIPFSFLPVDLLILKKRKVFLALFNNDARECPISLQDSNTKTFIR